MSKITKDTEFHRPCPECGDILYYSCKRYLNRAEDNKSVCRTCRKMPESMKKKLSEHFTGRKNPNYPSTKKGTTYSKWKYDCPDCGKPRYYARKDNMLRSKAKGAVCNSCANYKYDKTWNDVITDDHIKKMRAVKAGFTNWEEYQEKYPAKKQYQSEVRRLTRLQPIDTLPNFDKFRGLNGVEGAHQLDHIISIDSGWSSKIPPHYIAHISNLRIITWEENIKKGVMLDFVTTQPTPTDMFQVDFSGYPQEVLDKYKGRTINPKYYTNVPPTFIEWAEFSPPPADYTLGDNTTTVFTGSINNEK